MTPCPCGVSLWTYARPRKDPDRKLCVPDEERGHVLRIGTLELEKVSLRLVRLRALGSERAKQNREAVRLIRDVSKIDRNGQPGIDSAHATTSYDGRTFQSPNTEALLSSRGILNAIQYTSLPAVPHGLIVEDTKVPYMRRKHRIVIAEDHTILRQGLRALLASDPRFEVVAEAEDGLEAIDVVKQFGPDVVIMDLSMPRMNGMGAIKEIKRIAPATRVLVLTVHKNEEYILASFQAGCDAYVLKYASHDELVSAIETVLKGQPYLSPAVSAVILEGYLEVQKTARLESPYSKLTEREREVLKLIAEGYKNRQIASLLTISVKTVERHRANLMKKLDLHSGPALATFAVEQGLTCKE